MYRDIEVTPEDEEEMIRHIAQKIHEGGMDVAAILLIESIKPLSYVGSQMGRFFISPVLPFFGNNIGISGEKFFQIFEKRDNAEKLVKAVEALAREMKEQKKAEKAKKLEEKKANMAEGEEPERKGWKRFLPF